MRVQGIVGVALVAAALGAGCGECIGTMDCRVAAQISASGQVVNYLTGGPVGGTELLFVRDSGIRLTFDTVRAIAGDEGYFAIRSEAVREGVVHGHVRIAAPSFQAYEVPYLALSTVTGRGDGTFLGRFVAKPYFRLVGVVRDRKTLNPLDGVTVRMRRNSGGRLPVDTITFVTDRGVFTWNPEVAEIGPINATFTITAAGYSRPYVITRELPLLFRDGEMSLQMLPVGMGFPYFARAIRRGLGVPLPGASVEISRISGVATTPSQATLSVNSEGAFDIALEPQTPGSLYVSVRVVPPAPFTVETRTFGLATSDDDIKKFLGNIGYGAHVYFGAELRDSVTNELIAEDTHVRIRRTGGLVLEHVAPPAEGDLRVVNSRGRIEYGSPTASIGQVTFDLVVQLPPPFAWDTLRAISIPARMNDTIVDLGTLRVRRRPKP